MKIYIIINIKKKKKKKKKKRYKIDAITLHGNNNKEEKSSFGIKTIGTLVKWNKKNIIISNKIFIY